MKLNVDRLNNMMREVELKAAKAKRELERFENWQKCLDEDDRIESRDEGLELEWELRKARADRRRLRELYD